ncbi:MAG TPA: lysylphosphatidylglycerol synthase transmembrane domain-containing protein [Solirubrobacteraceae bacterium]|nr:lysylphosphatidylglycerol synthase transmembrane domain-containing protein [Solirubrobacteraceae bacterium]
MEGRAETRGRDARLSLPDELSTRRLVRRALTVVAMLAVVGLVAALAPGLDAVRARFADARPGWLVAAVALELLSGVSYVAMFRPVFCPRMSWRTSWEIAWSELAVGSLVPASGAGGLALGAWILRQGGMPGEQIARRSVAFFLVKSSVNFAAVAILGTVMALGLAGPHRSLLLTALPAALSALTIAAVVGVSRLGPGREPAPGAARPRRWLAAVRLAVVAGAREAVAIVRSRNVLVLAGAIGYWAFDNAVLWATYHAFGASVPLTVVLMGYLIGQLGGLLPIPGGVGGIDGGLIGTLIVYGAPAAATAAAVLAYRAILFWLPLLIGGIAFAALRRGLNQPERPDLCHPVPSPVAAGR